MEERTLRAGLFVLPFSPVIPYHSIMKRRNFTTLTIVGALTAALGVSFGSPLERWARRFGVQIEDGETLLLRLEHCHPRIVAKVLNELDSIADGALYCEGSRVRGNINARPFVLNFG